jgi:hypothetical protein
MDDHPPDHDPFDEILFPEESLQNIEFSGDGNYVGDLQQIGEQRIVYGTNIEGDVNFFGQPEERHTFTTRAVLNSHLTSTVLGVLGLLFTLVPVASIWQFFQPTISQVSDGGVLTDPPSMNPAWIFVAVFGGMACALTWSAFRITRHRRIGLSRFAFLPAASTEEGRFVLTRLQGACPECGGKQKFYSALTKKYGALSAEFKNWLFGERKPIARCKRDPDHILSVNRTSPE